MSDTKARTTGFGAANNFDMQLPDKSGVGKNRVPADIGERPAVELDADDDRITAREVTRESAATTFVAFRTVVGDTPTLLLGKDMKRKRVVISYYENAPCVMIGSRASVTGLDGYLIPSGLAFETAVTDETYIVNTGQTVSSVYVWVETYA